MAFGALALVASCTLTRTTVDNCKTNADCRAAFGPAFVCDGDGLCAAAPPNPRCKDTYPPDLLTRPANYPNATIFGYELLSTIDTQLARANAVRLAATQVGEEGGLDGRTFGIVFCDIAENAQLDALKRLDAAVADGHYLADVIGARAIIGPSASDDVAAVFQALAGEDVLVISPSATSPALTGIDVTNPTDDHPGLLWRTAPPDTLQGTAIARYLSGLTPAITNVTVIHERGAYGDALTQVFQSAFKGNVRDVPFTSGSTSERDAAVVDGPTGAPQVVIFISGFSSDGIAFLNAVSSLASYDKIQLFLTDSAANADVLAQATNAKAVFPRVHGSRPSVPAGPVHDLFRTSFTAAFKADPDAFTFVAHAYDAAWLTFYGAAWSLRHEHVLSGTGIAKGLRHISAGEDVQVSPASWKHVADVLGAGGTVNVTGASGTLDYDPKTEETFGLVDIWTVSADGKSIDIATTIDPR